MSIYGITDLFTTSYAEEKRNQFRKLIKDLDYAMYKYDSISEKAHDNIRIIHTRLLGIGDPSKGEMIFLYDDLVTKSFKNFNQLTLIMDTARSLLSSKMQEAQAQLAYYEARVAEEDRRRREYEAGEI